MAAKRAVIWCECTCEHCGKMIGFHYKNEKTISRLKDAIKDWRYCGEEGNLCPECYEKRKEYARERREKWNYERQVLATEYSQ